MEIAIGEHWLKLVRLSVPNAEHVLVSKVLLKSSEHELLGVFGSIRITNRLHQQTVDEQLAMVEHRPPMRVAVVRNASIVHVSHKTERQLA